MNTTQSIAPFEIHTCLAQRVPEVFGTMLNCTVTPVEDGPDFS